MLDSISNSANLVTCLICAALLDTKQHRKIHLDTEVWSWGIGDHGQLGHADLLNRLSFVLIFDHTYWQIFI